MNTTARDYQDTINSILNAVFDTHYITIVEHMYDGDITDTDDVLHYIRMWVEDSWSILFSLDLTEEEQENYIPSHKELIDLAIEKGTCTKEEVSRWIKRKDYPAIDSAIIEIFYEDELSFFERSIRFTIDRELDNVIADREDNHEEEDEDDDDNYDADVELSDEDYDEGFDEALEIRHKRRLYY